MDESQRTIPLNTATETPTGEVTRERVTHLHQQANKGDQSSAKELREIIASHQEIWAPFGDLSRHVEESLIQMISRGDVLISESLRAKIGELRDSLRVNNEASVMENLLVDDLILSWLENHHARMASLQPQQHTRDARFWNERFEQAHARYEAALTRLIDLRKP